MGFNAEKRLDIVFVRWNFYLDAELSKSKL